MLRALAPLPAAPALALQVSSSGQYNEPPATRDPLPRTIDQSIPFSAIRQLAFRLWGVGKVRLAVGPPGSRSSGSSPLRPPLMLLDIF